MTSNSGACQRVLIVDDDVVFCKTISAALRRRGIKTLIAHSVEEGQCEAQAWAPDGVLIDLRMPGGSGLLLVDYLSQHHPKAQAVVLTGFGSIATAVEATKLGAVQYLTKPVSVDEILSAFAGEAPEERPEAPASLDAIERAHLNRVLAECDGNISEAARRLGMHRRTLQRKLARIG